MLIKFLGGLNQTSDQRIGAKLYVKRSITIDNFYQIDGYFVEWCKNYFKNS